MRSIQPSFPVRQGAAGPGVPAEGRKRGRRCGRPLLATCGPRRRCCETNESHPHAPRHHFQGARAERPWWSRRWACRGGETPGRCESWTVGSSRCWVALRRPRPGRLSQARNEAQGCRPDDGAGRSQTRCARGGAQAGTWPVVVLATPRRRKTELGSKLRTPLLRPAPPRSQASSSRGAGGNAAQAATHLRRGSSLGPWTWAPSGR